MSQCGCPVDAKTEFTVLVKDKKSKRPISDIVVDCPGTSIEAKLKIIDEGKVHVTVRYTWSPGCDDDACGEITIQDAAQEYRRQKIARRSIQDEPIELSMERE